MQIKAVDYLAPSSQFEDWKSRFNRISSSKSSRTSFKRSIHFGRCFQTVAHKRNLLHYEKKIVSIEPSIIIKICIHNV